MPRARDFIGRAEEPADANTQQLYEAQIVNTPSGPGDEVFVTIQEFDEGKHKHGPVIWSPREFNGEENLPSKNDLCLVAKPTTTGSVWLLEWR